MLSKTLSPAIWRRWRWSARRWTAGMTTSRAAASSRSTARNSSDSCVRGSNVDVRVDSACIGRARVEKGRLVLDEPTTLPDGTVIDLVADDEGDDLTEDGRRILHEALEASWKSAEAGRLRPASEI